MSVEKKVPEIRFKGFSGEWCEIDLASTCSNFRSGKFIKAEDIKQYGAYPVYGGNGLRGFTSEYNHEGVYALIGRQGALCGNMNFSYGKAFFTEHAIAVQANEKNDTLFFYYKLGLMNLGQYSGQSAQPGLSVNKITELETYIPEKEEQTAIGNTFQKLDSLINQHQQKHDQLSNIKKAMLEKMFPKAGETIPEIRFKGFSGQWVSKRLGECFNERVERCDEGELISVTTNSGIKRFRELGRHDNSSEDKSNYKKVEIGDIAYNSMRMWQGASGYSPYTGILSPAYTVIIPKENIDSLFFSYLIKKPEVIQVFQNRSQGITSDTWNLKFPAFSEIEIIRPDIEEQTAIGNYFQKLDALINQHQQQISKLTHIKQACLSKMFV